MNKRILKWIGIIILAFLILGTINRMKNPISNPNNNSLENNQEYGPGDYTFLLEYNGLERKYLVHVPSSYNKENPIPLVLSFHGGGGSPEGHRSMTEMDDSSDKNNFIVIYPRGMRPDKNNNKVFGRFWNVGIGPGGELTSGIKDIDDVGFVNALLDDVESKFSIDTQKIYSTGFSNGGMLSHLLACKLSNRIAAIASVSGPFWTFPEQCEPNRAIPVIYFHGTADICAPYNGGPSNCELGIAGNKRIFISTEETIDIWKEKNDCLLNIETIYQKGEVICKSYNQCPRDAEVILCTIEDGGHTWPSGKPNNPLGFEIGKVTLDINANEAIWDFFEKHPMK